MDITRRSFLRGSLALLATGAVAGVAPVLNGYAANPLDLAVNFGAKGDGTTDDTAAIMRAFASGVPLTGGGRTYAVSGTLTPPAFRGLINAKLKQLDPYVEERRTLYIYNSDGWIIDNVEIDCGGNSLYLGALVANYTNFNAGIRVESSHNWIIRNTVIRNGGPMTGLRLQSCRNGTVVDCTIKDFIYSLSPDPPDDCIQGIHVLLCENLRISRNRIFNLNGYLGRVLKNGGLSRYTRGIAIGGCKDSIVSENDIHHVGQGIDLTGSFENRNVSVIENTIQDVGVVGIKGGTFFSESKISGNVIRRPGLWGIGVYGIASGIPLDYPITHNILISDNIVFDVGANKLFAGVDEIAAFKCDIESGSPTYPKGITFSNCSAIDEQASPTMEYGFHCTVRPSPEPYLNKAVNCQVIGATIAKFSGIAGEGVGALDGQEVIEAR